MSTLSVNAKLLTSFKPTLTQASLALQNAYNSLQASFSIPMGYEIGSLRNQVQSLSIRISQMDRFIKESGYAYEQLEQRLYQKALQIGKLYQNEENNQDSTWTSLLYRASDLPIAAIAQKMMWEQGNTTAKSQYGKWLFYPLDVYHDASIQGFTNRSIKSLMEKGVGGNMSAGFHLVRWIRTDKMAQLQGKADIALGNVEVSGSIHSVLFDKNYQFQPKLEAEVCASASAISSLIQLDWHNSFLNTSMSAQGEVGVAKASARAVINKQELTLEGEVGVAAAHGEVKGQIELWGTTITLTAEGEVGAIGIGGTFSTTDHSFEIGSKFSCLLGTGWNVRFDW